MALNDAQMAQFLAMQQAAVKEQVLYQFNCGSMTFNEATKTVTPDKRKGKIVVTMEDDGLLRFSWRLRHKDDNEQQYLLFPKGATWERVSECKDGSVYLLKFKDSKARKFFWSQEPPTTAAPSASSSSSSSTAADKDKPAPSKGKKDAEILRKIRKLLESPPKFGAKPPTEEELAKEAAEDEATAAAAEAAANNAMSDVPPSVVVPAAGGVALVQGTGHATSSPTADSTHGAVLHPAPGTIAPAAGTSATTSASATPSTGGAASTAGAPDVNSLMSTLNAMAQQLQARQSASSATASSGAGVEDVLEADRVQKILDVDSALVDALVEYLPEGQRSPAALRAQLRSPQLQQTMQRLTQILNSSQFGQLMASMSLPVSGSSGFGLDGFIAAIQSQADKQNKQSQQPK